MLPAGHLKYAPPDRPERCYVIDTQPAALDDGRFAVMVFIAPDPEGWAAGQQSFNSP